MSTQILLDGGHDVFAKNIDPKVVEIMLEDHAAQTDPGVFLRLQSTDYGEDGLILRPSKVVALVRC